ncbi:BEM46 family protein [Eremomyces bilateralis CBS 781.70]|uniref:BEM46 family protein n=1 Tax=Eremomyces bilateralis CBS 781.70 TaxID=1392243 RepID=A0A6G1GCQ2_9PEZI|nr:BEM46 family protein [Eremomyces bilateralis CBS 781.70]KAF1815671.1 BEM46 family protein [Eremomyces bilateralis CBS 781.70]
MSNYISNMVSYLRLPVLASSGLAVLGSGLLYFKQNEIIYPRAIPPDARTNVPRPSQFGLTSSEELLLPTPDGESLSAFLLRPSDSSPRSNVTVIMFHGNAGNIGHRLPIGKILVEAVGCHVLMVEYRGYGLSSGNPNEKGLQIDAQTALDYVRRRAELRGSKIVVYGQSLGGAVGIWLVQRNLKHGDVKGLILENTFLSIRKLIPSAFPPARYLAPLCHQVWPSEQLLPQIEDVPILFLSGLQDEIVPASQMKALFDSCRSDAKSWREFPGGTHNDTVAQPNYFESIQEWAFDYVVRNSS